MESKRFRKTNKYSDGAGNRKVPLYYNPLQKLLLKFLIIGDFGVGKYNLTNVNFNMLIVKKIIILCL